MTAKNTSHAHQSQIRELIEEQATAIQAKDVVGATRNYDPNVLSFDVVDPLRKTGLEACVKRTTEWFESFDGPIGFERLELTISNSDDVAFCHCLNQVSGTKVDGAKLEMWWRATICLRKIDDKWVITHEHASVPFNTETGMASLNLMP